jgi:Bacterial protein of unknown function (DUF922)
MTRSASTGGRLRGTATPTSAAGDERAAEQRRLNPLASAQGAVDRLGRADIRTRSAALVQLQRSSGNRAVSRKLGGMQLPVLQRDDAAPTGGDAAAEPELAPAELMMTDAGFIPLQQGGTQGQGSQTGSQSGAATRPTPSSIRHDCASCNEAAAYLNAGNYVGEASVQAASAAGQIRVSGSKGAFIAEVDVSWSIDVAASSMEVTDFVWPNMTDADRAAVGSFRGALLAHEEGHFTASEQVTTALTKTLKATGATQRAAVAALKTLAQQQMKDGQAALDKARNDYDNLTKHGANQAAVGGTNVHLACPRKAPASESGGAASPGPEAEEGE